MMMLMRRGISRLQSDRLAVISLGLTDFANGFLNYLHTSIASHYLVDQFAHLIVADRSVTDGIAIFERLVAEEVHGNADHENKVDVFDLLGFVILQ